MNARTWVESYMKSMSPDLIRCAMVEHVDLSDDSDRADNEALLVDGYTEAQREQFWQDLDFEFDYGCGEISGTIWLKNGRWMEVVSSNGSDSWVMKDAPPIPKRLKEHPWVFETVGEFRLYPPLIVKPGQTIENDDLGLHLFGRPEMTYEDCKADLLDELCFLWRSYVDADINRLTSDAIDLRNNLLARIARRS